MAPNAFSERDMELLRCAFLAQKEPSAFKVDYAKFAELAGLATPASGATSWGLLKKKLLKEIASAEPADPAEEGASGPSTKKRGRKAKTDEPKPPKKRAKKNAPKADEGDNGLSDYADASVAAAAALAKGADDEAAEEQT